MHRQTKERLKTLLDELRKTATHDTAAIVESHCREVYQLVKESVAAPAEENAVLSKQAAVAEHKLDAARHECVDLREQLDRERRQAACLRFQLGQAQRQRGTDETESAIQQMGMAIYAAGGMMASLVEHETLSATDADRCLHSWLIASATTFHWDHPEMPAAVILKKLFSVLESHGIELPSPEKKELLDQLSAVCRFIP
jgi:hypothetical protein